MEDLVSRLARRPLELAIGPSMLEVFASEDAWETDGPRIVVPEELVRLAGKIAEGSSEHRAFLVELIRYFRNRWSSETRESNDEHIAASIAERLLALVRAGRVIQIGPEVVDHEIEIALADAYPSFETTLSPPSKFLRDYLVKTYSWSKATGGVVIDRTRRVFSDVGRFVVALQLPDRADKLIGMKAAFYGQLFNFKGGRATRFFISMVVTVSTADPLVAGASFLLAYMDP